MKATTTLLLTLSLAAAVTAPEAVLAGPDRPAAPANDRHGAQQQQERAQSPRSRQQQPRRKIDADRGRQYHLTPHIRRYYASTR